MATILFQVTLDVAEQRDVANTGDNQQQRGTGENEDSECRGDRKTCRDKIIAGEVLSDVPPRALVAFRKVERVERKGVDDLTRAIGENKTLPT